MEGLEGANGPVNLKAKEAIMVKARLGRVYFFKEGNLIPLQRGPFSVYGPNKVVKTEIAEEESSQWDDILGVDVDPYEPEIY